jgi:hypothetical protein
MQPDGTYVRGREGARSSQRVLVDQAEKRRRRRAVVGNDGRGDPRRAADDPRRERAHEVITRSTP